MFPLLLMGTAAQAPAMSPIDAERAFAIDARTMGQWTAFRRWSTDGAVMFTPQPTSVHQFIKDRADPPEAIDRWPTASYVSCDGSVAVNTGGWRGPDGSVGYFSTVWQRQKDGGWKWVVDSGGTLQAPRPRPIKPLVKRASCPDRRRPQGGIVVTGTAAPSSNIRSGIGGSNDNTLTWLWLVRADGSRKFMAGYQNGRIFADAIDDEIAAPAK